MTRCLPQLIAAASLKQLAGLGFDAGRRPGLPQLIAAASLKRQFVLHLGGERRQSSAANRCGIIEAVKAEVGGTTASVVFRS